MEEIYRYLDKIRIEMEKLHAEYQTKTELFECLKKAYDLQLLKSEEAELQIEKQARSMDAQSEEISEARRNIENLKTSLHEKELYIEHLNSGSEKLHADYAEKLHRLAGKHKELLLALDEAYSENKELKQMLSASNEELMGLKGLLRDLENCIKAETQSQEFRVSGERNDMILKLEEGNRDFQEQLKWKQEQFNHLEEANGELQSHFQSYKKEQEKEKLLLHEAVSLLQISLDSQVRTSEDLQTRLEMSNQASGYEESERKDVLVDPNNESLFENLICERDEEAAIFSNLVAKKETLATELAYKTSNFDQKNGGLNESLEGYQEVVVRKPGFALLKSLHDKIKGLYQEHANCSKKLKARESEWRSQMGRLKLELMNCECELQRKQQQMQEVQMEVESSHFSVETLKEENFLLVMILQSEFSEAYRNLLSAKTQLELINKKNKDKIERLTGQLEAANSALMRTYLYLEGYSVEVSSFLKKIESLGHVDPRQTLSKQGRLSACHCQSDELVLQTEKIVKGDRGDVMERLSYLKEEAQQLHESLQAKVLETGVISQSENEQKNMDAQVKTLETEKVPFQDKLSQYAENRDMLALAEEICVQITQFCYDDIKLTELLEKILQSAKECRPEVC